ncbi:hypothetical protein A5722_05230 [Mycobacterium vulneris]|nr:hypothetical protein A5722_05230 [Mycolicibacterium vulneris]OCB61518.1 hypothetical protein A5729_03905 [Mycolicibacterium vulneris]
MSPAADAGAGLTRSKIENWDITHLEIAATRWRASADEFEQLFAQHRQNISAPGGTEWEGAAKDAALDRVNADSSVVGRHGEVVRAAADLADASIGDLRAAHRAALTAITEAEADGFRVAENLRVTDARRYDIATIVDRNRALAEHADNIQWNAGQLLATDTLVGQRLTDKATELDSAQFEGDGQDAVIQAAGFKQDSPPILPPDPGPEAAPAGPPVLHGYDPRIAGLPEPLREYVSDQLQGKPLPKPPLTPVTEEQLRERLRTQQEILDLKLAEFQRKYGVSCSESEIYTKIAGVLATGAAMGAGAPTAVTPPGFIAELGGIVSVKAQIDAIHKCFGEGA